MPNPSDYNNEDDFMGVCVPKMMDEGKDNDQAVAACMGMWKDHTDAMKYRVLVASVKAAGDWELDVLAAPFNRPDSDGQTFDAHTDFMLGEFSQPVIIYHHGIMPGAKDLQKTPTIIGKAQRVEVQSDGIHIRVLLDKSIEWARRVWEAAKKGLAVASSDSISHLARLEVAGKTIMYEKNRAGRIAVWPLAGLSLWDKVEGNFQPASRYALALPAMKAIYREAGLSFPKLDTDGAITNAPDDAAKRARVKEILKQSNAILAHREKTKGETQS